MARPPHYIREWRKKKKLTLEQLAEQIGMTHQNLGKIERYKVPYTQSVLENLAKALGVPEWVLIHHGPDRMPTEILALFDIPEPRHAEVMEILRVFSRDQS